MKTLNKSDVVTYRKSSLESYMQMINGDIYRALSASQSTRGHKCHKAYVQCGVEPNFVNLIVKPMLVISTLPAENRIEYFAQPTL